MILGGESGRRPVELTATPPHPSTFLGTALGKPKGNILRLGLFS